MSRHRVDRPGLSDVANPRASIRRRPSGSTCSKWYRIEWETVRPTVPTTPPRTGSSINKYKMAKHFKLKIADGLLRFEVTEETVREQSALDGIYVVRTSVTVDAIARDDVVRNYKRLTRIERDFRSMKLSGLEVRPIFHRTEARVRAHILLCMLAQYIQWHMQFAWRELLFAEEVDTTDTRDPVAPAKPSEAVKRKKGRKKNDDGLPVKSFKGLLRKLSTITKNISRMPSGDSFETIAKPDALQTRALELPCDFGPVVTSGPKSTGW